MTMGLSYMGPKSPAVEGERTKGKPGRGKRPLRLQAAIEYKAVG